jgi:molecular chaperone IbpA
MASNNGISRRAPGRNVSSSDFIRAPLNYGDPLLDRFFDSSIGFPEMFDRLFQRVPEKLDNYPPYNLIKYDFGYALEIAVAGFSREDISIYLEKDQLVIEGKQAKFSQEESNAVAKSVIHQGLAKRSFKHILKISNLIEVQEARLENGILKITLVEAEPEPPDRQYIKIG